MALPTLEPIEMGTFEGGLCRDAAVARAEALSDDGLAARCSWHPGT